MLTFWHEIAEVDTDDICWECGGGSSPDYDAIVRRLHNKWMDEVYGPVLGPPLPPSYIDTMLRTLYAPALRSAVNESTLLWKVMHRD